MRIEGFVTKANISGQKKSVPTELNARLIQKKNCFLAFCKKMQRQFMQFFPTNTFS